MPRRSFFLRYLFLALAVPALTLLTCVSLYAQADTGSIQGTIKDQSGAVIPNAKVTLTNEGTNLAITTTTGADGSYIFTPVKIGAYAVSVEAAGFAKALQSHITLSIQQQLVVDLTLKPGMVTQTIEVTAAPPALQTQNASVGQVVGSRQVNDLPLNGRNFTFLAQLSAGVNTPEADTRGNAQSGAFSANGMRPAQNNYLLNGIDNNSNTVDFLNGTNFVVLPPVDAINEFKVQSTNYSAQFGRAGGAILNATIKSGTNSIHGTVWEFLRNDKVDAADWFEVTGGVKKGAYRQNQFGAAIGGPIIKNKAFFFADYEGLRRRQGTVFTSSVPTAAERASNYADLSDLISGQPGNSPDTDILGRTTPYGTIFDPATTRAVTVGVPDPATGLTPTKSGFVRDPIFATPQTITGVTNFNTAPWLALLNHLPAGQIDANAVKLLNLYPAPNNSKLFSNYTSSPMLNEHRNAFDARVDINRGDKDQIFVTVSYVDDPQFIPGPFAGIADGGAFQQGIQTANTILGALSWTRTLSPTTVNEARIGVNRIGTSRTGPVPSELGLPAQYGIKDVPQVTLNGGLPAFGINGLSTLGSNAFLPSDEVTQTNQVTDNFTKSYGKHTFKAGIEYQRVKYSTLQPPWSHGQFNYDGVYTRMPGGNSENAGRANFLLTPASVCPASVPNCMPNVGGSNQVFLSNIAMTDDGKNYWGGYFEDDWKVSSKLTLNLGLRWEYFGQTFEHFGGQANFVPATLGGSAQYLIPANRKDVLSPSFYELTAKDNIAIVYTTNQGLGVSQKGNFGPRFGFAYQWTPKLVMRGGFGLFYNGFENRGYSPNIGENYPFQFGFSFNNNGDQNPINAASYSTFAGTNCANNYTFEAGFSCTPLQSDLVGASGLTLRGIQYNYQTPYTQGWNLTFQYELLPSTTVSLGYVGNSARHIEVFPGTNNVTQVIAPSADKKPYMPYPDFGQGNSYAATEGSSYYHSLQLSVERHFAKGLYFLANDTFSRTRSDAGDLLNGGVGEQYRCPDVADCGIQYDYRDANFDIRNVVHISGGYELPVGPGRHYLPNATGVEKHVLGGWSMQWILTAEGGQPATINCNTNPTNGLNCTALLLPGTRYTGKEAPDGMWNSAAFTQPCNPDTGGPAGCIPTTGLGRLGGAPTQVRAPGITRLDYSLFKDFQISERFRMQFRSEFFNILNHPTFMPPNLGGNGVVAIPGAGNYLDKNFGKSGATRFPTQDARQIQFALKLYF
ncbi:MAG: TonB-dependent receptor [Acidobacteriia bacterium]|nr:TonB-dependent receptor [Terriglobia bacterium]